MLSAFNGHHCQHRSDDFPLIAEIVNAHRPKTIVELGTDGGGFAAFLASLAQEWGGQVATFDIEAKWQPRLLSEHKNLHFVKGDILQRDAGGRPHGHPGVFELITEPHVMLYCDNGHKEDELALYAPLLGPWALLGVHDYGSEVRKDWCEAFLWGHDFAPYRHADFEALANEWYPEPMTRFWVRP